MADQLRPKAVFPAPPPFYKHFTGEDDISEDAKQYLVPPPLPSDGKYHSFGVLHDLSQPDISLADSGIQQLYPSVSNDDASHSRPDPSSHLLTLSRSILLNFLELVGILSTNPAHQAEKIEHLQTIFYNVHHLINQYRPHQARESLIALMQEQLTKYRDESLRIRECKKSMAEMYTKMQQTSTTADEDADRVLEQTRTTVELDASDRRQALRQRKWVMLQAEVG